MVFKFFTIVFVLFFFCFTDVNSAQLTVQEEKCGRDDSRGPYLYYNDFSWHMTIKEIDEKFIEIYSSGKRLKNRAYILGKEIILPFRDGVKLIKLNPIFIMSIQRHIEEAFKRKYVSALIFSDMGHSHFYIPNNYYYKVLAPIPSKDQYLLYEKMLAYPELKILYHTAEQLRTTNDDGSLIDDRDIKWRFFTRNLMGDNKAQGKMELLHERESSQNTSRSYDPGYRYWGAGFNISGSKDGCFSYIYKEQTYYFDISLNDLEIDPTLVDSSDMGF